MRMSGGARRRLFGYRTPTPTTAAFTDAQVQFGYFGTFDLATTAGRRNFDRSPSPQVSSAVWCGYITGTDATMNCFSGDSTPYIVQVDNGAEVTPILSGGKITLFSGLSDAPHLVQIRSDNSDTGQSVPTTGTLFSVTGISPSVSAVGASWYIKDPVFPGFETFAQTTPKGGNWTPAFNRPVCNGTFGISVGSLHFKANADDIWLFCALTEVWASVDGGAWTKHTLVDNAVVPGGYAKTWKKVAGLSGSVSSQRNIVISASATASGPLYISSGQIEGVMATGSGANIAAPAAKTVVTLFGASQVQGVGATPGSVDINRLQVPFPNMAAAQNGNAGATIAQAVTAFPTWAAGIKAANRQTIILSIGINSPDDAAFQSDYQTLITAALTAGFTKVVCRGLLLAGDSTSKNAKIAAAVAAVADPRVSFASVATWSAATTDLGGLTVWMPDGAHPNDMGYDRMAQLVVRDHSALLP